MTYKLAYRLTDILDPEERIEEAALFKAMCDHYGRDAVLPFRGDRLPEDNDIPVFGRNLPSYVPSRNPVPSRLDYWDDEAFLSRTRREFHVVTLDEAATVVRDFQSRDKTVFVKSARQKHFKMALRPEHDFRECLGDMAYSFIDGQLLLVQEFVPMEFEYRFFAIDGKIVTSSPNMEFLTPLDFPLGPGTLYRTPSSTTPTTDLAVVEALSRLADEVADEMEYPHACIDVAIVAGKPGLVEFNPMQLGHLGLFACDVRALAAASETLVASYQPASEPAFQSSPDESEFFDL